MSSFDTSGDTPTNSNSNSNSFHPWQPIFLAALAESGNISYAAQKAGITRQNAYLARSSRGFKGDHRLLALAFGQVWREALLHAAQTVELELRRRALEGEEREKRYYYKGECIDVQKYRVYDNRLLLFLAKHTLSQDHNDDIYGYLTDTFPLSLSGNHITGAGPDSRPLSESAYAQWHELTAIDDLVSDLWCQVLDILDGSTDPDEAEEDDDDDEVSEAEAETQSETDESEVSSQPTSDSQLSSPSLPETPPSTLGKGDATERRLGPDSCLLTSDSSSVSSQPDPAGDAPFRTESDSGESNCHLSDSQVSSETLPSTPHLPPEAQPSGGSLAQRPECFYEGSGKGDGGLGLNPPVSSEPSPTTPPTPDAPLPTDTPPPGVLVYDPATAYKHWQGLT